MDRALKIAELLFGLGTTIVTLARKGDAKAIDDIFPEQFAMDLELKRQEIAARARFGA